MTSPDPQAVPPDIEVWNRATSGVPYSDRPGDVALAHALRFDGYAAAGSVLTGIEMEIGEGWAGEGRAGFAYLGLADAARLIDEATAAYHALNDSGVEGDEHADRYDAIDAEWSERYDGVTEALGRAVAEVLGRDPRAFAPVTGRDVPPRVDEDDDLGVAPPVERLLASDPEERQPYAIDVDPAEKVRRSVAALTAVGIDAHEADGQLVLSVPTEADWAVVDAVLALIDRRYP